MLNNWPKSARSFLKVFPYEYQRVLKEMAAKNQTEVSKKETNGQEENGVVDIEETVRDVELEKKTLEKILDKTR